MNRTSMYEEEWLEKPTIDVGAGEPGSRRHGVSPTIASDSESSGSESEDRDEVSGGGEETKRVETKLNTVDEWKADTMEASVTQSTTSRDDDSSSTSEEEKETPSRRTQTCSDSDQNVDSLFGDEETNKPFYLERSITNKANCRHCRRMISKNEWRFGRAISRRKNHPEMFKAWYHADCIFLAYADPQSHTRKSNTTIPPYLLRDPAREINDWAFVEEEQRRKFVEQLAELHLRHKRDDDASLSENDSSDWEDDKLGQRSYRSKHTKRRKNGVPTNCSITEAPSLAVFGKRTVDPRLAEKCRREFAGLDGKHDSLEAFGRVRAFISRNKLNISERLDVLQIWFHPNTFQGDLFLWFTVLINVSMKRSFHVKDKQLIKLFSTKIFHVPLGTIESRILERNNRAGFCVRGCETNNPVSEPHSEASSGEEPNSLRLSRSVLRRINVRNLPSLLADMFTEMTNSRIKPRDQSTLSLRTVWDTLVSLGSMKKEVERNRSLARLLLQCTTRDIEEILRMLLSVLDIKLNKKHIIDAFSETAYTRWEGRKQKIFKEEHFFELASLIDWDALHAERQLLKDTLATVESKKSKKRKTCDKSLKHTNNLLSHVEGKLRQLNHHDNDSPATTVAASTSTTSTSSTSSTSTSATLASMDLPTPSTQQTQTPQTQTPQTQTPLIGTSVKNCAPSRNEQHSRNEQQIRQLPQDTNVSPNIPNENLHQMESLATPTLCSKKNKFDSMSELPQDVLCMEITPVPLSPRDINREITSCREETDQTITVLNPAKSQTDPLFTTTPPASSRYESSASNLVLHIPKKRRLEQSSPSTPCREPVVKAMKTHSPQHGISDGILAAALMAQRELPVTPGNSLGPSLSHTSDSTLSYAQRSPFHSVSYLLSSVAASNASHRASAVSSPNNCPFGCTPPLNQTPKTPTPVISMFNPTPRLLPPMIPLRSKSSSPIQQP